MLSYAVGAPTPAHPRGEPLVLFGSADPDSKAYALDAITGATVWHFQTLQRPAGCDCDVGAGITIGLPGGNGFKDGVAYVSGKDGIAYALDLTTGALIWKYVFEDPIVVNGARSTPALVGNQLVFGTSEGTFDLNATTGALNWHYVLPGVDENLGRGGHRGSARKPGRADDKSRRTIPSALPRHRGASVQLPDP